MSSENTYDLIIVGGGPIGLACGIAAKKAGLNLLIIEKGMLVNSIYQFPTNMTFFSTSKLLEIGEVPFISHSEKPTRREALEYFRRVQQSWDLNIQFYETVNGLDKGIDSNYVLKTSKGNYKCQSIILATGFYGDAVKMNVPGEELPKVKHYYTEAHPYVGQKLLIVGAANSACDVALETYHKGSKVTMVIRKDSIYDRVKYWIKPNIENRIKEGSIKAYFNSSVKSIHENSVILKTPDGELEIENDFVLAMTGYKPDYTFFDQIGIGIGLDEYATPIYDEETLESTLPNVYLAGVINGGLKTNRFFIENTRIHADMIVKSILEKDRLKTTKK